MKRIDFQSLDMFGPRNVGFIKLIADCVHRDTGVCGWRHTARVHTGSLAHGGWHTCSRANTCER